ncbi:YopX family protein, partial [Escherichia coli]|uniref:YopX family protein n=1 Tax=Escherichia coli TaxID=562 RepID=UPI0022E7C04C
YESNRWLFEWQYDGAGLYLMQFTGLHDKNGKEIYEGDILRWSSWVEGSYHEIAGVKNTNLVEWSNARGKWFVKSDLWDLGMYSDKEIIGNIYENPELL